MKRIRWLVFMIIILVFPFVTGCWDRLEIEDRGTVLGLAIDPIPSDAPQNITGSHAKGDLPGYRLTAQIAIPGRIPLGPGGGPSGGGEAQRPVWIISTTGKTVDDAMRVMQQELADKIFLGHLRVIIVNQEVMKKAGFNDMQDFFRRNAEIRRLAWLVVSTGDASQAMEAAPKLERVPTLYLVGTMDHAVALGKLPNIFLGNFWSASSAKGQDTVLPLITVEENDRIRLDGLAVMRTGKMVGSLDPLETAAFMELRNERRAGYGMAVPVPDDPSHSIILRGVNRKTKTRLRFDRGKPVFDTYTIMELNIEEKTGTKFINTSLLPKIEQEGSKELVDNQMKLVHKLQNLDADVLGLGERVRGYKPDFWNNQINNSREKWHEVFREVEIHPHAKLYIRRSGMAAH